MCPNWQVSLREHCIWSGTGIGNGEKMSLEAWVRDWKTSNGTGHFRSRTHFRPKTLPKFRPTKFVPKCPGDLPGAAAPAPKKTSMQHPVRPVGQGGRVCPWRSPSCCFVFTVNPFLNALTVVPTLITYNLAYRPNCGHGPECPDDSRLFGTGYELQSASCMHFGTEASGNHIVNDTKHVISESFLTDLTIVCSSFTRNYWFASAQLYRPLLSVDVS